MKALKGLIVGVANESSIAWGCAKALHSQGALCAITYQNDKAKPYVEPLANKLASPICMPLDVQDENQINQVFNVIRTEWGELDFLIHSIAFAPKKDLQGRVVDSTSSGFCLAMDVSCHSLIRLTKAAEPLMKKGGTILTLSYYGADKVVEHYNLMGPIKSALEASVRYLAMELGSQGIRVNAISPGPINTRAASGLSHFDELMVKAVEAAPLHQIVTIDAVGEMAAFLISEKAKFITGQVIYVDGGFNIHA